MKTLVLVRHAKTEISSNSGHDFDRKLIQRGQSDALDMALRLKQQQIIPDMIISSTAIRAQQTAHIFALTCDLPIDKIKSKYALYNATPDRIETVIESEVPSNVNTVLIVGHNPGITYYAASLGGISMIDSMPTCSMVAFNCDLKDWVDFPNQKPIFLFYDFPKNF